MMQNRTILRQSQFRLALLQNSVEHNLDRRRHAASAAYGATTPRRMAMRHGGGRGAEEKVRGTEPGEAQLHEGASGPAVDTCCLCGNERCRPCRSKGTRHAQSHQHNSATERFLKGELSNHKGIFDELHIRHPFCSDRKFTLFFQSGRLEKI